MDGLNSHDHLPQRIIVVKDYKSNKIISNIMYQLHWAAFHGEGEIRVRAACYFTESEMKRFDGKDQ
ncbi:hypothetical protein [Jeotgalibacillus soli]|uniref:Uncharacterized protein n=1 Tax=Jeotgalibacillus soli TaxID=889306 RepID=A0A0C2R914_9BACL|nr:hypothetical protein [Jeotgalibacillus soli]KIL46805.1 hypothetical protein KP78_19230 [Jeotgalibacillus soli]